MTVEECWEECAPDDIATLKCFECIIQSLLNLAVRLGGVIVFIMFIIGGFKLLTAGGDPKSAQAARNTLTYAVLGLALLILAWFILRFIEVFTGVTVTEFTIPT